MVNGVARGIRSPTPVGWIVRFAEIGHKAGWKSGGTSKVQALIELLAGLIAALAAAALAQFGVDLDTTPTPDREIHRVGDCQDAPAAVVIAVQRSDDS